jgi:hypothetical protein
MDEERCAFFVFVEICEEEFIQTLNPHNSNASILSRTEQHIR